MATQKSSQTATKITPVSKTVGPCLRPVTYPDRSGRARTPADGLCRFKYRVDPINSCKCTIRQRLLVYTDLLVFMENLRVLVDNISSLFIMVKIILFLYLCTKYVFLWHADSCSVSEIL